MTLPHIRCSHQNPVARLLEAVAESRVEEPLPDLPLRATSYLFGNHDHVPTHSKEKKTGIHHKEIELGLHVVRQKDPTCPTRHVLSTLAKGTCIDPPLSLMIEGKNVRMLKTDSKHVFAIFHRALLGKGSYKEVFLALRLDKKGVEGERGNRLYACSIGHAKAIAREQEALAAAHALSSHEEVLPIVASGPLIMQSQEQYYLITPYCDGGSFESLAECHDQGYVHARLKEAAQHIAHMHRSRFVLNDLKPENLLIRNDHAVLSDLEFAEFQGRVWDKVPMGTPGFGPPELGQNKTLDYGRDVWGFGCTLYYIFSKGRHLFSTSHGAEPISLYLQIRSTTQAEIDAKIDALTSVTMAEKSLLKAVLNVNPNTRPSMENILAHPFWQSIDTTAPEYE